ncbi:hypothetical protein O3M35_000135 [Rhynocoris fuscipes]|uniref:DUF4780 domain-containing protein n=1 Tax=Rhynocoris fuscipes TaxID=488301 RepID=A0AAW1DKD0_9HEMI
MDSQQNSTPPPSGVNRDQIGLKDIGKAIRARVISLNDVLLLTEDELRLYPLPSSGRRRLAELLGQGMEYLQAKKIVISAMVYRKQEKSTSDNKRTNSEDNIPKDLKPPSKKPKTKTREKNLSEKVVFEKVAIVPVGYPDVQLEQSKHGDVLQSLMEEYVKVPQGTKIVLDRWNSRPGHILVSCSNKESADWVISMVPLLKPWIGCSLIALRGDELPKPIALTVFVPFEFGKRIDGEGVLKRLDISNPELDTSQWKVLGESAAEKGQVVTVSVDEESYRTLRKMDMNPKCGFGKIKFRVRGGSRGMPVLSSPEPSTSWSQEPIPSTSQIYSEPILTPSQRHIEPVASPTAAFRGRGLQLNNKYHRIRLNVKKLRQWECNDVNNRGSFNTSILWIQQLLLY